MTARRLAVLGCVACLAAPAARGADLGVVWIATPVRAPVAPKDASPLYPFVPTAAPETTGPVDVGPDRAAAIWLDPLEVVRVTRRAGAKPRFVRVVGDGRARALAAEPGAPIDERSAYLAQPPGRGDLWLISADADATIVVERPLVRAARTAWNRAEDDVAAWIDRGAGEPPPIPVAAGSAEVVLLLRGQADLAAAMVARQPTLAGPLAAWRKASALLHLWAVRPLLLQHFFLAEPDIPGATGSAALAIDEDIEPDRPYRRVAAGETHASVTVSGPGVLRVDVRGLADPRVPRPVSVTVREGARVGGAGASDGTPAVRPDDVQPPAAIPDKRPLVTRDGEAVTGLARAAVAVPPGKHTFAVTLSGGPLLVRPVWATRRPRFAHAPSVAALLDDARRGGPAAAALADGKLPDVPAGASPALYGWLVVENARAAASPRALLASLRRPLPAEALPALAELLPEPTLLERLRVQEAGALALAFRARFYDPGVTEPYRAAWRGGVWSVVPPGGADDPDRPNPWTWLDAAAEGPTFPALPPPPREQATLFRVPLAAKVTVAIPPSPHDPARPGVIPVYVATTADAPGPFTLTVDGVAFPGIGLAPVERMEIAAPPGNHDIRVEAPPGSDAWVGLTPAQPLEAAALRRYWPTTARAHWPLPDAHVPGAVRVELRAPAGTDGPLAVEIRSDTGERRMLRFEPGGEDPQALPVDAPGLVSGGVTLVFEPPTGTRELWIDCERELYAQVAVRRAGDPTRTATPAAAAPARSEADALARIAALTRGIRDRADDTAALVERAHLLLDLQQGDLARQDLLRLARLPAHRLGPAETELQDRVDAYADPAYVPLPGARDGPVPLAPGLLALGADAEALAALVPAARAARNDGPAAGAARLPAAGAIAAWARARLVADVGRQADAGLHLAKLSTQPAIALEALALLLRALEGPRSPPPGTAAAAFGLASRLRQVTDHPTVRRALIVAGAGSRWTSLEGVEASAGLERLLVGDDPSPLEKVRQALLPTPWPAGAAHTLPPGLSAGLDVTLAGPARLTAQAFCVEVRVSDEATTCRLTFRIDGRELGKMRLEPGKAVALPAEAVGAGRHRLEAALAHSSTGALASVRFLSDRAFPGTGPAEGAAYPIAIEKPERLWTAEAKRPIVVTVLGPATLRVTARALVAGGATALRVEADSRDDAVRDGVALDPALDDGARGDGDRRVRVNRAAEGFVLLTQAAPYRVTIRPDRGAALVRLALREDAPGAAPRIPPPWWDGASPSALLPWPGLAPGFSPLDAPTYCAPAPRGLGSVSFELYVGTQPIGEQDAVGLFHGLVQVGPTWRAQPTRNLWLKVAPVVRIHDDTPIAFGITSALYAQALPGDFRLNLQLASYTQNYSGTQAFSFTANARLDRPIPLGGAFSLIPGVGVRGARLTLDRATVVTTGEDTDSEVYNDFTRTHPWTITPRVALAAWPFQDLLANVSFSGTTYRDQKSLDHVSGSLDAYALVPVLGETFVHAGYGVNYRFVTADRLEAFLRHELSAALEWSVWTGDEGRFVLGLSDTSYVIAGEWSHVVALGLRYDWTGGRGLTDMLPTEEYFDELTERREYLPAPPGRPLP